jgi:hypothetical protein
LVASVALFASVGCASELRRFPLRDPVWVDDDLRPVSVPCRPDPEEPGEVSCRPEEYVSPFLWDVGDNLVFRPMSRFFAVDPGGPAANVNAFDEVPDSSWFENRIGLRAMTPADVELGNCGANRIDPRASAPGSWVIDMGKPNGANPGFRVRIEGVGRFMLKADAKKDGERTTAASAIVSRLYHAAGWRTPCDSVVHFDRSLLRLSPGLVYADNSGVERPFDQAALDGVLDGAIHRGELVRMVASAWLPGRSIGPFRYEGVRADDPNDLVPHEDRRDLRGARLMAAWVGHFDAREQNTMTTWMSLDPKRKDASPGYTLHHYLDFGDCFGSQWAWDALTRRLNHAHYLDFGQILVDTFTFGAIERPWDRSRIVPGQELFNHFSDDFDPDAWRGGYPNPAFARMDEADGAWAARILARFEDAHLAAAIRAGDLTEARHAAYLERVLARRRDAILRRHFARLSPVSDVTVRGDRLCAVDLARRTRTWPPSAFRYSAVRWAGHPIEPRGRVAIELGQEGGLCLSLPRVELAGAAADDDPRRYVVVDLENGVAPGPLRLHLYDLGAARGHRLVGIERPASDEPPG